MCYLDFLTCVADKDKDAQTVTYPKVTVPQTCTGTLSLVTRRIYDKQ